MYRLLGLLAFFALISQAPAFGEGQKGNFALSFQGGGFGNLEGRFFKTLSPVFSGGLEYYPLSAVAAGIQFQFSPKNSFGSPVSLGVGSVSASGSRESNRLFQTTFFLRPMVAASSAVKLFALAGVSLTKISLTATGGEISTGSGNPDNEGHRIGAKFGAGTFIHLKSNIHLNLTSAFDTQPQKLFSTQAGLVFFFNPFPQKTDLKKTF